MPEHPHQSGHNEAIGNKIRKLKGEGKTQKQAVGQALGMAKRKQFANPNAGHLWPETNLHGGNPRRY